MEKGFFISLEGIDGSGKTTQIPLLVNFIGSLGLEVVSVREPGGTRISEKIRELLLDVKNQEMSFRAEALLYGASRAQLVEEIIKPALNDGKVVIADRYLDSTIAYQGYGRGLDLEFLQQLNILATGDLVPDLTMVLMVSPQMAYQRRKRGDSDRLEGEGLLFQQQVYNGYKALAEEEANEANRLDNNVQDGYLALARRDKRARIHLIDGEADPKVVAKLIQERVLAGIKQKGIIS
ncbi:MAG: dTMP kinase [Methylocystaceae bacterium]